MRIEALVKRAQRALADAEARAKAARDELSTLTDGRDDLTDAEAARAKELMPELREARSAVDAARAELAEVEAVAAEEAEFDRRAALTTPTGAAEVERATADVHVTHEPRTYARENDPKGKQFIRDVAANYMFRDPSAGARLERHMQEERVERDSQLGAYEQRDSNATSSAFGSIVVPQYLIDMTAPAVAGMRPFADICNHHDLPAEGLSLTIPRITTPTAVSDQSAELQVGGEQAIDETDLELSVRTALGDQTISRQALERGRGTDDIVMQDLVKRYATNLDSQLLNLATVGLEAVAAATTTNTEATPTLANMYSYLEGGAAGIEATMLGMAVPDYVIMHSRRWHWMSAQMTNTWPFVQNHQGSLGSGVQNANSRYGGVRGTLPSGLQVVVDNNIKTDVTDGSITDADHAYVVPSSECHLWEDPSAPVFIRAEQPAAAKLGVLLVLYGYYAFTFQRYGSGLVSKVAGLPAPTF